MFVFGFAGPTKKKAKHGKRVVFKVREFFFSLGKGSTPRATSALTGRTGAEIHLPPGLGGPGFQKSPCAMGACVPCWGAKHWGAFVPPRLGAEGPLPLRIARALSATPAHHRCLQNQKAPPKSHLFNHHHAHAVSTGLCFFFPRPPFFGRGHSRPWTRTRM